MLGEERNGWRSSSESAFASSATMKGSPAQASPDGLGEMCRKSHDACVMSRASWGYALPCAARRANAAMISASESQFSDPKEKSSIMSDRHALRKQLEM